MPATHDNAGIAAWRFNLKAEIGSYGEASSFLGGARDRQLGPNMVVREHSTSQSWRDYIAVVLYDTEIIRYYADGTFSVDNGGHNTPTTRERLQAVAPDGFMVYHHDHKLGLIYTPDRRMGDHPRGAKSQGHSVLWPLDHSRRISPTTITIIEGD